MNLIELDNLIYSLDTDKQTREFYIEMRVALVERIQKDVLTKITGIKGV